MAKNWLVFVIFNNLGRLFNNPQLFNRLEDRIAESGPVRMLARTVVGIWRRGAWEMKQLQQLQQDAVKGLSDAETFEKGQQMLSKRLKEMAEESKRMRSKR